MQLSPELDPDSESESELSEPDESLELSLPEVEDFFVKPSN